MSKRKKIPFGTWLLIVAAFVNVSRWVGAFLVTENAPQWVYETLPILGVISGLSMGLVMAGGIAFVFHKIVGLQPIHRRTIKGQEKKFVNMRFWIPFLVGASILILSVYLLPPYMLMSMSAEFKSELENPIAWARAAVLSADLIIVAIAAVDSKAAGFTASNEPAKPGSKPATSKPKPASEPKQPAFICSKCQKGKQKVFGSQAALNAHQRKHALEGEPESYTLTIEPTKRTGEK